MAVGTARSAVADALEAARERWHKSADLNAVRADIDALLRGGRRRCVCRRACCTTSGGAWIGRRRRTAAIAARASHAFAPQSNLRPSVSPTRFAALRRTARATCPLSPSRPRRRNTRAAWRRARTSLRRRTRCQARPRRGGIGARPGPGRCRRHCQQTAVCASPSRPRRAPPCLRAAKLYPRGMPALDALRLSLGALAGADV